MYQRTTTFHDTYVEIQILTKNNKQYTILYDLEDHELLDNFMWSINGNEYGRTSIYITSTQKRNILMHRFILGIYDDSSCIVDHINRNKLDNRRSNLRIVSTVENSRNKIGWGEVPYKGVSISKKHNYKSIIATITADGKLIKLGTYKTIEDAAKAYDSAANHFFGEFAVLNFPNEIPAPYHILEATNKSNTEQYNYNMVNAFIPRSLILSTVDSLLQSMDGVSIKDVQLELEKVRPKSKIYNAHMTKTMASLFKMWSDNGTLDRKWMNDAKHTRYIYSRPKSDIERNTVYLSNSWKLVTE